MITVETRSEGNDSYIDSYISSHPATVATL